jgi:hypothetical protein
MVYLSIIHRWLHSALGGARRARHVRPGVSQTLVTTGSALPVSRPRYATRVPTNLPAYLVAWSLSLSLSLSLSPLCCLDAQTASRAAVLACNDDIACLPAFFSRPLNTMQVRKCLAVRLGLFSVEQLGAVSSDWYITWEALRLFMLVFVLVSLIVLVVVLMVCLVVHSVVADAGRTFLPRVRVQGLL